MEEGMHEKYLRRSFELAEAAKQRGNFPFGALLVQPPTATSPSKVLLEAENTIITQHDPTRHAELNLCSASAKTFDRQTLKGCILYTSTEPCAMCAGGVYWVGIGTIVFGLSNERLSTLAKGCKDGGLKPSCREILDTSRNPIAIIGPLLEDEAAKVHHNFWDNVKD